MPRVTLSSSFCATATCPPGKRKIDYWDKAIPGFVLECRANGSGTYALRYVDAHGVQRQHRIGTLGVMHFDDSRKAARKFRSEIELGGDPAARKAEKRSVPLVNTVCDQVEAHAKASLRSWRNVEMIMRKYIRPRFGKMRLDAVTAQAIALWLAELRESGLAFASVEKIRVYLHRLYELAAKWDIPGAERNPVKAVPRPRFSNQRQTYIDAAQAARLVAACERSPNPVLAAIVLLLLLTGARKMELLRAKWEHVDLVQKSWHIPDSKTGKARYVPLSQAAIDVIKGLPRLCPWLVPNPETLEPFVSIKRAWMTARAEAGLPDLRIHDLRHSAASFMINAGTDLYAVGKVLGHADYQSTMRYSHLANDTLMRAVEAGAAKMQGVVDHGL